MLEQALRLSRFLALTSDDTVDSVPCLFKTFNRFNNMGGMTNHMGEFDAWLTSQVKHFHSSAPQFFSKSSMQLSESIANCCTSLNG